MRYGPFIGKKVGALKAATDSNYRFVMLFMMLLELVLLAVLVVLEGISMVKPMVVMPPGPPTVPVKACAVFDFPNLVWRMDYRADCPVPLEWSVPK